MTIVDLSRSREGWNINGQNVPNWEFLKSEAKKNPPRWTLIMDNQDKAREWKDEIGGEVTYRSWGQDETYYHYHNDAKATAQQMARETEKVADCWQYHKMNEAGAPYDRLQDWLIDFAIEARKQNRKVTTNGLALLKLWQNPEYVKAGNVDKLIRFWAEGNNREWFIPNVHVYITGRTASSVAPNYPANLLDLDISRNAHNYHINYQNYDNPLQWYHRELWAFNVRAMELIGEPVWFIIDECKYDYHASVQDFTVTHEGRTAKLDVFLRERYGDDRYNREMRGILGQRKFIEWIITGELNKPVSDEVYCDYLIQDAQWWEDEYPDNCLAFMNYTMNVDWRFPTADNGNFGHDAIPLAPILLPKMRTIKPRNSDTPLPPIEPPIEPPPVEDEMLALEIRAISDAVRIRETATLTATQVGWIKPILWQAALVSKDILTRDGYHWRKVEVNDVTGYSAFSQVGGAQLVENQDITPEVPTDDIVMTKADFEILKSAFDTANEIIIKYDE